MSDATALPTAVSSGNDRGHEAFPVLDEAQSIDEEALRQPAIAVGEGEGAAAIQALHAVLAS